MAKKAAAARLRTELAKIHSDPPPYITVAVNERNVLLWSFLIEGPPETPYAGGWYWGRIKFPNEYPFKPPALLMVTPSGRFQPDTRLCLSMSDFHPETWNPGWTVATILTGLLSFMTGDQMTTGAIESSDASVTKARCVPLRAVAGLCNAGAPRCGLPAASPSLC